MLLYGRGILSEQHIEMLYLCCLSGLPSVADLPAPELTCQSSISIRCAIRGIPFGAITFLEAPARYM